MTSKQVLSLEQKNIIAIIDILRDDKEVLKLNVLDMQTKIIDIDIQIRALRQSIPEFAPTPTPKTTKKPIVKHVKTDEERLAEITKEIEEIKARMATYKTKGDTN